MTSPAALPRPTSFALELDHAVVTITLDRPDRLNALTFEVYRELAETFERLDQLPEVRAIVITGRGRGFCSGGDQDDIIKHLLGQDTPALLAFTRATGRLIAAMRRCRRPIVAAINGVAVGAGAVIACASDLRIATSRARFGFIFPAVGLCGADMGITYLLPRIVGLGHASELLFFGDKIDAAEALRIGLVNRVVETPEEAVMMARAWADRLAAGPAFAHAMTKQMIESEARMPLAEAIEAEAQAQALCMQHPDFAAAHAAFKAGQQPVFAGAPPARPQLADAVGPQGDGGTQPGRPGRAP
ncbi:MAG: enoyl-CoA hydratase family protein [Kofleriaceae bacterium]|nr:enoyl-CoA hydratase family protein [Kofleriaceae bacterium]